MTFVQSFSQVTPPARYDAVPWTQAQIHESATETGTFTLIDTRPLPIDPTPETPNTVALTTTLATLAVGWYRVRFLDAVPNFSNFSDAVLAPTPASANACTIAQIDAYLNRGGVASEYDDALKIAGREAATVAFEKEAHRAVRLKTQTDVLDGTSGSYIFPSVPNPIAVTAFTVNGVVTTFTDIVVRTDGTLYRAAGWSADTNGLTVTYTHGMTSTPADVSNAIAVLAASMIKDGPYDDRGYGVTDDGGFVRLMTAGVSGASFSIPEVQAALMRYRLPVIG